MLAAYQLLSTDALQMCLIDVDRETVVQSCRSVPDMSEYVPVHLSSAEDDDVDFVEIAELEYFKKASVWKK